MSGYTTYDKYLEYKETGNTDAFDAANKEGYAEYIFQISSSVGISEALLKNTNYGTTKVYYSCGPYENVEYVFVNGEGDTDTTLNKHNIGDVSGFSWGENTLKARIVFAGTEMTSSRPCHITGLPYNISFHENTTPSGWSLNNNGSCYDRLVLKRGNASAITPSFWIPNEVNIKSILSAYAYRGSVGNYTPTVSIHASESGVNSTINATLSGSSELPYTAKYSDIESNITLTNSVKKVCIYTSGKGSDWSVGSGDMGVVCQSFVILYR